MAKDAREGIRWQVKPQLRALIEKHVVADIPDELAAFRRLADRLAKLDGAALDTTLA